MIRATRSRLSLSWPRAFGLLLTATLALAVAMALPPISVEHEVYDLIVVVDITQSMNVPDYTLDGEPVSRLTWVKHGLGQALTRLPCGSKLGLAIFTEYRSFLLFTPVDVCANRRELAAAVEGINGQMAWAGDSEIAKGLYSGLLIAKAVEGSPALVFITDGQEAPPINPHHRPEFTGKPGDVKGVIVGVGGSKPAPIPKVDPEGKPLGFWKPNEVLQTDLYALGRQGSMAQEEMVETEPESAVLPQLRGAPGSEHLSFLHAEYLKLLATETRLTFGRLTTPESLLAMLTDEALARRVKIPTDLRWIAALGALLAMLASYLPQRGGERDGTALVPAARTIHDAHDREHDWNLD